MKLSEYLSENKLTHERFAESVNVHHSSVTRWISGERSPHRPHLEKIIEVTSGAVTANDFLNVAIPATEGAD